MSSDVMTGLAWSIGLFAVVLFLLKILWKLTIPEVFPGAVREGLIVGSLSWWAAFNVALFFAVLGAFI